jgi:DNA-binding MarR family transcriptional regulator
MLQFIKLIMVNPMKTSKYNEKTRFDLANRLFFRLYQCDNMLQKTGSRLVNLSTTQWAVLGALSREQAKSGMSMGDLVKYLKVSRQNLAGLITRMVRDGHIEVQADTKDRRSKLVRLTRQGHKIWHEEAIPKIADYYESALADFSNGDLIHTLHYLMKLLENMERIDQPEIE